ncbi:MAG: NUDIX hydrolase [Bacteroidetes bacterium QS_8_64_10]|nr:MAG: NUDIX hydrolase [Bacteroidetes bacterium QS_8_64_10]
MLLFYRADENELDRIRREGLPAGATLHGTLEAARRRDPECLLVVDALAWVEETSASLDPKTSGPPVPARFIENLTPCRPPVPVTAAGGYVVRPAGESGEPELLVIYRRGVWDLPKGKQEEGESVEECARREVCEEVGAERMRLVRELGATVHGYPMDERHAVKTTHWFLMATPEREFTPQREEDIEQVAWMPWSEAKRRVGYATLRHHMTRCKMDVFEATRRG